MANIKILDCTLRDGGYLNEWHFGYDTIIDIINSLAKSNIEYTEIGFYTPEAKCNRDYTLYNDLSIINNTAINSKKTVMFNFKEDIQNFSGDLPKSIELRIAFKQKDLANLHLLTDILSENKVTFSLNPMHIGLYTNSDMDKLIQITNKYNPVCLTAVDTMGITDNKRVKEVFDIFDNSIDYNISFGFHSHDNLNLALSNVITLLEQNYNHDIVIDSCLSGIGRGGGLLKTEDICEYLNDNYGKNYNTELLKLLSEKYIKDIIEKCDFYNKEAYFLSAQNKCHPNYAKYLIKHNYSLEEMKEIFLKLPPDKKISYSEEELINLLK